MPSFSAPPAAKSRLACLTIISLCNTIKNGRQAMIEFPPRLRRAARRLRLVTLAAAALIELLILFAAWVHLNGKASDFPGLDIDTGGLPAMPGAILLLLFGLLIGLALLRAAALFRQGGAGGAAPPPR